MKSSQAQIECMSYYKRLKYTRRKTIHDMLRYASLIKEIMQDIRKLAFVIDMIDKQINSTLDEYLIAIQDRKEKQSKILISE